MKNHTAKHGNVLERVRPLTDRHEKETQPYGDIVKLPIGLAESACKASAENLNQLLADTITLRDMYKKHHWQVAGPTFYQLHLLYDKHYKEQANSWICWQNGSRHLAGSVLQWPMTSRKRRTFPDCQEVGKTLQRNYLDYSMRMKSFCSRQERWPDRLLKGEMTGRMISL